jgi:hypothetical protein
MGYVMDSQIVAAYIGLTGVGLGILFSGIAYFWKIRAEQKRIINKILYSLLEVRHQIKLNYLSVPKMRQYYLNFLNNYFEKNHLPKNQVPKEILTAIESHFKRLISSLRMPNNHSTDKYQELITQLAGTKPLLAFKLSSIDIFSSLIETQNSYKDQLPELLTGVDFTQQIEDLSENLNDDATNQLMNEINRLIMLVTFNCGLYTFIYFYIAMKLSKKPEIKLTDEEKLAIENSLTEFLNAYVQQLTKT